MTPPESLFSWPLLLVSLALVAVGLVTWRGLNRALVLREGRVVHDGDLGSLGRDHRTGHEHEHPLHDRNLLDGTVERRWRS